ncbi:MAG: hypothetical protein K6T94_03890 [Paenibacillus sp.]|nr:hypothetical protein [Paenibacillus sp.]
MEQRSVRGASADHNNLSLTHLHGFWDSPLFYLISLNTFTSQTHTKGIPDLTEATDG